MSQRGENEKQPSHRPKRRRRWFQLSLRTLLVMVTVAAVSAALWRWYTEPFRRQRLAMAAIEKAGGSYETVAGGPAWLRRILGEGFFQDITLVNVADCDDPAAYFDHVAALPALETLVVGGQLFTDEHLGCLHGLTTLRGLVLDCTNVSDAGLEALREALPEADVYQSQRRAIAAIRKAGGIMGGRVETQASTSSPQLRQLVDAQWFDQATRVSLWPYPDIRIKSLGDAELVWFKWLRDLSSADIGRTQVSDVGLRSLEGLDQLEWLHVDETETSDAGLESLKGLRRLKLLRLDKTSVSDTGVARLTHLQELEDLGLGGTQVTDAGLALLKGFSKLRTLSLRDTQVTDAGLVKLKALGRLGYLDLGGTKVSDAGLERLKSLTQLGSLELSRTGITDVGVEHLKGLPVLSSLHLRGTNISDAGLVHLSALPRLAHLTLDRTRVGDTGLAHLKRQGNLATLSLAGTQVTDAGIAHLEAFPELNFLDLRDTKVTDAAVPHITKLKSLHFMHLSDYITDEGIKELMQGLPNSRFAFGTKRQEELRRQDKLRQQMRKKPR